jgi:DNA-directed RNA polymerase specialized sigma24 family protein
MKELPPGQGEAVRLGCSEGQTPGDIAAWLEPPLGAVKSRVRLACQKLRAVHEDRR